MKRQSKFIASVLKTANEDTPPLPFQRGVARKALMARLRGELQMDTRKSA